LQKAEDCAACGGFAAAGFPNEAKRLSFINVEADVVDGLDVSRYTREDTASNREIFFEISNAQQRFGFSGHECNEPPDARQRARAKSGPPCIRSFSCSNAPRTNILWANAADSAPCPRSLRADLSSERWSRYSERIEEDLQCMDVSDCEKRPLPVR